MSRISQLINEIKEIGATASHRNAIQVYKILDGNSLLFSQAMGKDTFSPILRDFERMSEASAREFNTSSFSNDYGRAYSLLMFYLDRVIG